MTQQTPHKSAPTLKRITEAAIVPTNSVAVLKHSTAVLCAVAATAQPSPAPITLPMHKVKPANNNHRSRSSAELTPKINKLILVYT